MMNELFDIMRQLFVILNITDKNKKFYMYDIEINEKKQNAILELEKKAIKDGYYSYAGSDDPIYKIHKFIVSMCLCTRTDMRGSRATIIRSDKVIKTTVYTVFEQWF